MSPRPPMLRKSLVGVIGSGLIGYDPFDRRTWSGSSYQFFNQLREKRALHRAFGVEVPRFRKALLMLRHVHPDRAIWRKHYYMSRSYRENLTEVVRSQLQPQDFEHDFMILGAMYDVPGILGGRSRCFSYHDGNLSRSLKSPYAPKGLSTRRIDEGLEFERRVYHGIDCIFAMSEYLRRSFIDDFGVAPERVKNVGAGINLDEFPNPFPDKRYDTQEILFIGVDFPRKGGPGLLAAFQRVRQTHPQSKLHIVGPRVLTIPDHLAAGVEYHGFLNKSIPADRARLDKLFEVCSLFVLPSLYEPFGIAPLEAMAHEIPALVSRGWALEESVTPGVTGEHVEIGSVDDLAQRLTTMLSDPQALMRMGQAARNVVRERFTWPQVVDRMLEGIKSVQGG